MQKECTEDEGGIPGPPLEGRDYYIDTLSQNLVFTAAYLEKRGSCCGMGCRHCPYEPRHGGSQAKLMRTSTQS